VGTVRNTLIVVLGFATDVLGGVLALLARSSWRRRDAGSPWSVSGSIRDCSGASRRAVLRDLARRHFDWPVRLPAPWFMVIRKASPRIPLTFTG